MAGSVISTRNPFGDERANFVDRFTFFRVSVGIGDRLVSMRRAMPGRRDRQQGENQRRVSPRAIPQAPVYPSHSGFPVLCSRSKITKQANGKQLIQQLDGVALANHTFY